MTDKEIEQYKTLIDGMTQIEMARLWRFAPLGSVYFDTNSPIHDYYMSKFKGMTPEISKKIGWGTV